MKQASEVVAARDVATTRARPVPLGATALVLFNEKAGSVGPNDRDKLIEALGAAGIEKYALVGADKISKKLFSRAKNFDVVIVLGGDGTARAAAELAPRNGPPLILLPGGTLNILPHALYGTLAWPEALAAALERGVVQRLPAGRANGKRFFVAAIFGAPTLLARAREAMREGRPIAAIGKLRHFTKRAFTGGLRARPDKQRARKAEAVGVLCPAFSGEVRGDHLEWVNLAAKDFVELARVSFSAITSAWRNDAAIEIARCLRGDIISLGVIPATLDGEPSTFFSRVHIEYDPKGPKVIVLEPEA